MKITAIVLAAGRSLRFGEADKLLADFRGRPLCCHAIEALRPLPLHERIAVTRNAQVSGLFTAAGYEAIDVAAEEALQSRSLRAGVERARSGRASHVLIVLADMPNVASAHLAALLALAKGGAAATTDGRRRMPPAVLPAALFAELTFLSGDRGAGGLLGALPPDRLLRVDDGVLADIDTSEDLARMSAGHPSGRARDIPDREH